MYNLSPYIYEKMFSAVNGLVGSSNIQQRLCFACESMLRLSESHINEMPTEWQKRFREIERQVTSTPAIANEGTMTASINRLSEEEAENVAEEIFSLFCDVAARDELSIKIASETE